MFKTIYDQLFNTSEGPNKTIFSEMQMKQYCPLAHTNSENHTLANFRFQRSNTQMFY